MQQVKLPFIIFGFVKPVSRASTHTDSRNTKQTTPDVSTHSTCLALQKVSTPLFLHLVFSTPSPMTSAAYRIVNTTCE